MKAGSLVPPPGLKRRRCVALEVLKLPAVPGMPRTALSCCKTRSGLCGTGLWALPMLIMWKPQALRGEGNIIEVVHAEAASGRHVEVTIPAAQQ